MKLLTISFTIVLNVLLSFVPIVLKAQQMPDQLNPPFISNGVNSAAAWSRAGNSNIAGTNNIFGTRWNSPIYFITNGVLWTDPKYDPASIRMRLNGRTTNTIDNYSVTTTGYLGLGLNYNNLWDRPINNPNLNGPFTLLHLSGNNGVSLDFRGFRPWMGTGISFTSNNDFSYIGHRRVDFINDLTEFAFTWGDNDENDMWEDDDLVFRFMDQANGTVNYSTDFLSPNDYDGRHVARFTSNGRFGLGPSFGPIPLSNTNPNGYAKPQSILHISEYQTRDAWLQITNQSGTEQSATDGLRIGLFNNVGNIEGHIRYQENQPLIFSTHNVSGQTSDSERMRVVSTTAPGVPDPSTAQAPNPTRVSISEGGVLPVTAPRSLLHLGFNTSGTGSSFYDDGWRHWMDVGMFIKGRPIGNIPSGNIYLGQWNNSLGQIDAVLNWGDNDVSPNAHNLRFIFTKSNVQNELEVARMVPNNGGMMGIGDFSLIPQNNLNYIGAKLDIKGDLRIRSVNKDNSLIQLLAIDPTDLNRVKWIDKNTLGGGGGSPSANNGVSFNIATNNIELGNNVGLNLAELTNDREIPLNNQNIYFTIGNNPYNNNNVAIGLPSAFGPPTSRLHIHNPQYNTTQSIAALTVENLEPGLSITQTITGIQTFVETPSSPSTGSMHIGGLFKAAGAEENYGIKVFGGDPASSFITGHSYGVHSQCHSADRINYAIYGHATSALGENYGLYSEAEGGDDYSFGVKTISKGKTGNIETIGISAEAIGGTNAVGIYATASQGTNSNRAGLFKGDVHIDGTLTKLSGSFKIDHPKDPYNKYLLHSFIESPDMMNVYNGNIITNEEGIAIVKLPDYFESLNKDYRYQLTVIGEFAQAIIFEEIKNNAFTIKTDKPQVKVSWQVTGIRNDTYAQENRINVEVDKSNDEKGKLLYQPKTAKH